MKYGFWLLLLGFSVGHGGQRGPSKEVGTRSFYLMGTRVTIEAEAEHPLLDQALEKAYAELAHVDALMSSYRPESELSRINRLAARVPVRISPATARVLQEALRIASASKGAFDPTVGPLLRLWERQGALRSSPQPGQLHATLSRVGFRQVLLDAVRRRVRLARKGMELDLGGIAKGWAVDRAIASLRRAGARYAVVDLGQSSIGVFGRRLTFWIRSPRAPQGAPLGALTLTQGTISTSAGYGRELAPRNGHSSHIIDPRSGLPIARSLSATVIGPEGEGAKVDALSTAGLVLGAEKALALWQTEQVEGILFYVRDGMLDHVSTPGFPLR